MKKIFKNPIFMFISGGLIFGGLGIGVYAISASEITYNNATVADVIDGLYQINSYQTDYSTEEKVVGTWIDGKPVYQKTYTGTATGTSNQFIAVETIPSDCENIVAAYGAYKLTTSSIGGQGDLNVAISPTGTLLVQQKYTVDSVSYNYKVTIQYTKTSNQNNG